MSAPNQPQSSSPPPQPHSSTTDVDSDIVILNEQPGFTQPPSPNPLTAYQAQQERMVKLHEACRKGEKGVVREVLSNGMELLESIDPVTGLTPMLQAIYASQVEVVKELMMAGAFPPPPTITQDPAILAVLYPPQRHVPFAHGMPHNGPHFAPASPIQPEFGYYPPVSNGVPHVETNGHANGHHPHHTRKQSMNGDRHNGDAANLPPSEVAKTIPCRNFPNCRYGEQCIFQHPAVQHIPQQPQQHQPFYPSPYQPEFVPAPYQGMPMYYGMMPSAFVPMESQLPVFQPRPPVEVNAVSPVPQQPSAPSPVSPAFNGFPAQTPSPGTEQPQPGSVSAPVSALPPPTAPVFQPRGPALNGVQAPQPQFPQHSTFDHPRKIHHAKRMSFNGVPRNGFLPGAAHQAQTRSQALGSWSNGQPPACVFFMNSKCRNGDMCKFPHVMPDGTDSRHPDVVAGSVAAAPISTNPNFRPPRARLSVGNQFHFDRQQHFLKVQANQVARQQAIPRAPQTEAAPVEETAEAEKPAETAETAEVKEVQAEKVEEKQAVDAVPVVNGRKASPPAQVNGITRSVPATRAHSPTSASQASARGPRPGARQNHIVNGNSARSTSIPAAPKEVKQKLPSASDFPALAGSVSSLNGDSGVLVKSGPYGGRTAAEVLSAPAPPKPVSEKRSDEDELERVGSLDAESSLGKGISAESDDEAVIISLKASPQPAVEAAPAPAAPKGPISFASIAGKPSQNGAAPESAPMVASQA